jgi:hypothetical protein
MRDTDAFFEKYHAKNPHVYDMFVKYAREVKAAGHNKFSIWAVANRVRWHYNFEVRGTYKYKISNDLLSRYSRRIMEREVDLVGFFNVKRLKQEAAAAYDLIEQ